MRQWFAVNTLPRQEGRAEENLVRQGIDVFLPKVRRIRRHARRRDHILEAMFPSYLFVSMDCEHALWRRINGTYGVRSLVMGQGKPLALPSRFCDDLRARADAAGAVTLPPPHLDIGDRVRVAEGPFEGHFGTVVRLAARQRVELLLAVLGGLVRTEADACGLAPAR